MKEPQKRDSLLNGVAIVGMSCRFPGAAGVEELWRNLQDGVESIRFFSREELEAAGVDPARLRDPGYVPARAVLEDVETFDAAFFGFNPNVAAAMDPQQRLFLECAWEALERAGYDSAAYPGAIGVFGGMGINTYLLSRTGGPGSLSGALGGLQTSIGNRNDHLTTMVAYRLNLKGPAVTVQTACSTSLVAVHLACQSLLSYQCQMALAGGVRVTVPQREGYLFRTGDILSPDGHCRPFDARAQGTVSGSGAGVVLLKRLADALADGDLIHAVIRGSAINNDGSAKAGYTAPSIEGQAKVIARAQALAGVRPEEVSYVEAHGTGTPLGDPIEVAALTRVFRAKSPKKGFCALGSVKSNFGHLDTAAGVAGLIKTTLALERRQIPPSLHFERPNPELRLEESPFYVSSSLSEWKTDGAPRVAGVSSFGIGGTNVHVVLEEAPARKPSGPSRPWQLLLLSARSGPALDQATDALLRHLKQEPEIDLADAAYTLRVGRRAFPHRRALVCRSAAEAVEILGSLNPTRLFTSLQPPRPRPVIFQFPGQGSQYARMGQELYEAEPEFRRQVDLCSELLAPRLGLDLRAEILAPEEESRLEQTFLTQPALFVLEYALARLWMSWGFTPRAMIGHSLGEYVAACLAGVFSLEDALQVVTERGRLIQSLPPGAMLSVQLPEAELARRLPDDLSLAAVNRPSLCVVSGPVEAIEKLERELTAEEVAVRRLRTSHAFHSAMMEPVLAPFEELLRSLPLQPPSLPFVSNLTGRWIEPGEATDPGYWVQHLRSTVRFSEGLETLLREGEAVFLEVGPGTTLTSLTRQHPARSPHHLLLASLQQGRKRGPEEASLLTVLGRLWLNGSEVDWKAFHGTERRQRLPLPTYPFERRRHWIDRGRTQEWSHPADGPWKADRGDWFWVPAWNRSCPAGVLPAAMGERLRWLLFIDSAGLGEAVGGRLRELGQDVVQVRAGDGFARLGDGLYAVRPAEPTDYALLLSAVEDEGGLPRRILHLWGVEPAGEVEATPALRREMLERGFYSLLFLAQALGGRMERPPLQLDVVTSRMQEVVGGDLLWPEKAAALGPCKVIPKEYEDIRCRSIDLFRPGDVRELLAEVLSAAAEPSVAYRGGHRWTQTFLPVHLEAPGGLGGLRHEGVYLITGGFRGIGLVVAEHLARTVSARLVLTARSPLPPRAGWPAWTEEHGEDDEVSRTIRRLEGLEELGAQVLALTADVTDEERMRGVVAEARERFGALHGVFHSAGVPPGGLIQLKSAEAAARILAPKVEGARTLLAALSGVELDFLALFSSRSSVFAPPGSVDYTAANAFLDALAHAVRPVGGPRIFAIDWCGWEEVGMRADAAAELRERVAAREDDLPAGREKAAHPLLGWRHGGPDGRQVYESEFRLSTHWMVSEHRIAGYPVVPGTTYLEMARAAIADRSRQAEIFDVFFLTPMRLREDETRRVRLSVTPTEEGFDLLVESRTLGAEGAPWTRNAMAKVRPLPPEPPRRLDLGEILARCRRQEILATVRDEQNEDHGARWQIVKRVYVGDGEVLASLELPEAYEGDLEHYHLHPSLIDRGASIGEAYLTDGAPYLPFSYRSLRFRGALPRKIYSHARLTSGGESHRETISFNISILDEDGRELVEIREYVKKRVNDATEHVRAGGPLTAGVEAMAETGDPEETGGETSRRAISSAEGIDALRRILAHEVPPQVLVSPNDLLEAIAVADARRLPSLDKAELEAEAAPGRGQERPSLATPYAAPGNEVERRLATLWQEVLGFAEVGIHDNFFELGGDSLLAIQIIARARRSGLEITPNLIFEHQTIAELAERLEPGEPSAPPLVPVPRGGDLPLSFPQERLWFLARLDPESPAYNVPSAILMTGRLDVAALAASLEEILRRHEVLRTRFAEVGGRPVQIVEPPRRPELPLIDLSALPTERREPALRALAAERSAKPFDLRHAPLLRVTLFRLAPEEHLALSVFHHAAVDGWSFGIFLHELEEVYAARIAGRPPRLRDLPIQYADYAAWQRSWLSGEILERKLAFWRQYLAGVPPVLDLADRPRPARRGSRAGSFSFVLPSEDAAGLTAVGRQGDATLFMTLLTAFETLLSRYSGKDDLVVGTPIANRDHPEIEGLIGMFVNTLALRAELAGDPTFSKLLERVRRRMPEVYANQDLPFEKLVEALDLPRSLSHTPLFQVMLVVRNFNPVERVALEGLEFRPAAVETAGAQLDLTLVIAGGESDLRCLLEYDRDLFDPSTVERMAGHFMELVRGVAADPGRRLSELPLLTAAERAELASWNETSVSHPDVSLHELIAAQAERTPDAVAVAFEGSSLTYRELSGRASALAGHLAELGVGPETLVGICAERSLEMVVGLLGILQAGGAYVPLDPTYPSERLTFLLEDAAVPVLLVQSHLLDRLPAHGARTVRLDGEAWEAAPIRPAGSADPGFAAYAIFTSGSTGRPKGAVNSHRAIVNRLLWMQSEYRLTSEDSVLQKTPFSFDVSVWEFFWPLVVGARLVMARQGGHQDPGYLVDTIRREGITTIHFVPSMLQAFVEQPGVERCVSLRRVVASGEALPADLANRAFARLPHGVELHNLYGPTEAAVDVTYHACRPGEERVPIGRPVANTRIHLLDRQGNPVPVSVPGELCVAGVQVGRGYLRRPDLTAERFVPDPFGDRSSRMYRTGDLARRLPGGEIEYLGRIDHQVKVRGFRIELGEIEEVLLHFPGVREAAVVAWDAEVGGRQLAAYVGCDPETAPTPGELRPFLQKTLPDYMIPAVFVPLAVLPRNANGKLDRSALPAPRPRPTLEGRVAPRTPLEEVLAGIMAEVLRLDEVGVLDDFFALGGHSLLALEMLSLVRETFGVEVSVARVFDTPTVAGLAAYLTGDPEHRRRVDAVMPVLLAVAGEAGDEVAVS